MQLDQNKHALNSNGVTNYVLISTFFARIKTRLQKLKRFLRDLKLCLRNEYMFRLQVQQLMLEYKPEAHGRGKLALFSAR